VSALPTYSAIFDYAAQPKVDLRHCPVCGRYNLAHQQVDRFGYEIGASACVCGVSYLNPRMTTEAYAQFYASGAYRALIQAKYPQNGAARRAAVQSQYGAMLAIHLKHRGVASRVDLLDAGGGTGAVAEALTRTLPMRSVTVLDPSARELWAAVDRGYRTIEAPIEQMPTTLGPYGAIICTQTIDHLCEPLEALERLRAVSKGWFWVDIVECGWKIDHPLYWTLRGLKEALRRTGWTVKDTIRLDGGRRAGVLCG